MLSAMNHCGKPFFQDENSMHVAGNRFFGVIPETPVLRIDLSVDEVTASSIAEKDKTWFLGGDNEACLPDDVRG